MLSLVILLTLQSADSSHGSERLAEFVAYNSSYREETLKGFRCNIGYEHSLEKMPFGKDTIHIKRAGEFTYTRMGNMQRVESLAEFDGYPGALGLLLLAFDGQQGYCIEGDPLQPFGLNYSTQLQLPPFNYQSILPEWVMHGTYFGPLPVHLKYLNYDYDESALMATDDGIVLTGLGINGPLRPTTAADADQVWQLKLLSEQSPLLSEVRCFRIPAFPGEAPVVTQILGSSFWLNSSWEVIETCVVDRIVLPKRVRYQSYHWEPTNDPQRWNKYYQEILVEYRDWVTSSNLALSKDDFRIVRPLGVPVRDPLQRAISISDSVVVGISRSQIEHYCRLMDGFVPDEEPELTVAATVEEAVESFSHGLRVNCAGISLLLFLRRVGVKLDPNVLENFPMTLGGDSTIGELINYSEAVGHKLMAKPVTFSDLPAGTEGIIYFAPPDLSGVGHFATVISHKGELWIVDPPSHPYPLLERRRDKMILITTPDRMVASSFLNVTGIAVLVLVSLATLMIVLSRRRVGRR